MRDLCGASETGNRGKNTALEKLSKNDGTQKEKKMKKLITRLLIKVVSSYYQSEPR